jgi:hypothetical protein
MVHECYAQSEFYTKSDIEQDLGWTAKMINTILGEPDIRKPLIRRTNRVAHLYRRARVFAVMESDEYKKAISKRRSNINAVITKYKQTVENAVYMPISFELPECSFEEFANAVKAKHTKHISPPQYIVNRWCVNTLRHEYTQYEHSLHAQFRRVGIDMAIQIIRFRVFKQLYNIFNGALNTEIIRQSRCKLIFDLHTRLRTPTSDEELLRIANLKKYMPGKAAK